MPRLLDRRGFAWFGDARRDLIHAARLLRRNPIVAVVSAVSLAIGIGANTTVFTVANALLFKAPPGIAEPSRVVDIGSSRSGGRFGPSSYLNYLDIRQRATTVEVYAYSRFPQAIGVSSGDSIAENISGALVTLNYFGVLGAVPSIGRLFDSSDSEQPGASPVVVLSHRFWTRRFNNDLAIVGRVLMLNGRPFTVIGVASEAFNGTGVRALDAWVPIGMAATLNAAGRTTLTDRTATRVLIGGRLNPGVSLSQAQAEIDVIGHTLESEYPENRETGLRLAAMSPVPGNTGPIVALVALLTAIVSLVLIIACANVGGVLLARATARRHEMALRLAIGAGRSRLVRQLLAETLLLFMLGGTTGLLLARAITSVLVSKLPALPFPVALSLALDGRVMLFTVGLSLAAALLSGLAPALTASKTDVVSGLKNEVWLAGRMRSRHAFVVVQVAFTIVLITAAGLFGRALHRAASTDPGFDSHGVELMSMDLAQAGYTNVTGPRFARELLERVRQIPGVQAATIATTLPGGFEVWRQSVAARGEASERTPRFVTVDWNVVESGYFSTLRTSIVAGRDFTIADDGGSQPVAIVSQAAARQFWPDQAAVGKYLSQPTWGPQGPVNPTRILRVVGVASDIDSSSLIDGFGGASVYVPLQQQYASTLTIAARTAGGRRISDELRRLVTSMNPNLAVLTAQTLDDSVALGLAPQRVAASIAGSLGIVGVVLAALGIYGVIAFAVTRRTREIGVRIALGARRGDIVAMVLREGLWLSAIGSCIGLAIASVLSRVLASFLFGISPTDPITFAGVTVVFTLVGLAACYSPIRRAARIDPIDALRYE